MYGSGQLSDTDQPHVRSTFNSTSCSLCQPLNRPHFPSFSLTFNLVCLLQINPQHMIRLQCHGEYVIRHDHGNEWSGELELHTVEREDAAVILHEIRRNVAGLELGEEDQV